MLPVTIAPPQSGAGLTLFPLVAAPYRSLAGVVVGGELEVDGRVLHLSAFPA